MLDAAIIGGGPAGVAAAISLKQLIGGSRIAVFDMRQSRWKPGETLSPTAMPILESLGCYAALQAAFGQGGAPLQAGVLRAWWIGITPDGHHLVNFQSGETNVYALDVRLP